MTYQERQERRRERLLERAAKKKQESEARYRAARATADAIPFGQPMLVDHHSYKGDRSRRERMRNNFEKSFALDAAATALESRADSVGEGGIASDDEEALDKLREKLAAMDRRAALMRAINAAWRKHGLPDPTNAEGWVLIRKTVPAETATDQDIEDARLG